MSTTASEEVSTTKTATSTAVTVLADKFLGLSKNAAQNMAESRSLVFRLVSVDGEMYLGYPAKENVGRNDTICVELVDYKVVKATLL